MKKYLFLLLVVFCLVGCKSKEEKAMEFLINYSKENNLPECDIANLEVTEAYDSPVNNSDCWDWAVFTANLEIEMASNPHKRIAYEDFCEEYYTKLKTLKDSLARQNSFVGYNCTFNLVAPGHRPESLRILVDKKFRRILLMEMPDNRVHKKARNILKNI